MEIAASHVQLSLSYKVALTMSPKWIFNIKIDLKPYSHTGEMPVVPEVSGNSQNNFSVVPLVVSSLDYPLPPQRLIYIWCGMVHFFSQESSTLFF